MSALVRELQMRARQTLNDMRQIGRQYEGEKICAAACILQHKCQATLCTAKRVFTTASRRLCTRKLSTIYRSYLIPTHTPLIMTHELWLSELPCSGHIPWMQTMMERLQQLQLLCNLAMYANTAQPLHCPARSARKLQRQTLSSFLAVSSFLSHLETIT